jgi:hypothetical protein
MSCAASVGRPVASYVLEGLGKRAIVVPLGIGPTMNASTDGPMDTVANDAWAGTSSGIATVCGPAGSSLSRITREVLFRFRGDERGVPPGDDGDVVWSVEGYADRPGLGVVGD